VALMLRGKGDRGFLDLCGCWGKAALLLGCSQTGRARCWERRALVRCAGFRREGIRDPRDNRGVWESWGFFWGGFVVVRESRWQGQGGKGYCGRCTTVINEGGVAG